MPRTKASREWPLHRAGKGDAMQFKPIAIWLYLLNAAVLLTHQIDAAFWHEWELFHIPGGSQLNLLLNLPLIVLVLFGLVALAQGRPAARFLYGLLAATGLFTAGIHSYFLLHGDTGFRLPVSLGLLAATLLLSLAQIAAWPRAPRHV
jgi:hypothetical protein